jgi:Fur family transcriptional regulator, peroxide stress response regulator
MTQTRVRDPERMHILLDMLRNRYDHPTAQDCYLEMSKRVPGVGKSTVYRHLSKLVEEGLIQELNISDGPARFDAATNCHAHFYCKKCKTMADVVDTKIVGKWPGHVEECSFIAKGVCEKCHTVNTKSDN